MVLAASACGGGSGDVGGAAGVPRDGLRLSEVEPVADGDVVPVRVGTLQLGEAAKLFSSPTGPGLDASGNLSGDTLAIAEVVEFRYQLEVFRTASGRYPSDVSEIQSDVPRWLVRYESDAPKSYELVVRFSTQETATLTAPE